MAAVLAVFAWQQGDGSGDDGGPLNAIAAAAEKTQEQPGGRATMRMEIASPDPSESLTMTGQAVFDDEAERSEMLMSFREPDSGDPVEMRMVLDGSVMYMSSSVLGDLPGDSRWMSLDLAAVVGADLSVPTESDPKSELEALEAATGVRKLGKATVRGVPTTRYGGVLSVSDQAAGLREQGADEFASKVEDEGTPARVEVWIDAKGLARRMRIVSTDPGEDGGMPTTADMRMDFLDFGLVPEIEVPAADEVFDATSMAEEELDE